MEEENQNQPEYMEEIEVNVMEFSLFEEEIDELIEKLQELKTTKGQIEFELDEENELVINYEKDEE